MKTTTNFDGRTVAACCDEADAIVWRRDDAVGDASWQIPLDRRVLDEPIWVDVRYCPWCGRQLTPPEAG